jgi:hydroxymethylglutaryl-CoA lyase
MKRLKPRSGVRYTTLVPNEKGLDRAMACGVKEIAVFASASESYSRKNLNRSRADAIAGYGPLIAKAKDAGLRVRGYLSMVFADPWDGPTDPSFVADTLVRNGVRLTGLWEEELGLEEVFMRVTRGETQ